MHNALLHSESHFPLPFNPNRKLLIPLHTTFSPIKPSFSPSPSKTQIPNAITCARNSSKRRIVHKRPTKKWLLKSLCFAASKLNILPEPLAMAIAEFAGGGGGGSGFFPRGFGPGGFDGRRRRKGRNKLGFLGVLMVCGIGMWFVVLGKDFNIDALFGVLAFSLFGVSIGGWRRGFKDWVLGFCFCASLVGLGFRREKLQTLVDPKKLKSFLDLQKLKSVVKDFRAVETALRRRK